MITEQSLFDLLRYEICDFKLRENIIPYDFASLFYLANRHDVANMVGDALYCNQLLPNDKIGDAFKKQMMLAVIRVEQQSEGLKKIKQVFDSVKIPYIPLKGSVIRELYPKPWMRTSCDIDIFIKEKDIDKATKILVKNGFETDEEKHSHDMHFYYNNIHLELHFNFKEEIVTEKSGLVLKAIWKYSYTKPNSSCHYLADEFLYYHHIAHMAKHFIHGGCGIRPFIDLWILNHRVSYDVEKRKELLAQGGLIAFESVAVRLSEVWLSGREFDDLTLQMGKMVLFGGVYGNDQNKILIQRGKKGGKIKYIMSRIFLPYSVLKFHYPILQKHKWLLPFMEIRRWFKIVFKGGIKRATREIKINRSISNEKQDETAKMMDQLGLL